MGLFLVNKITTFTTYHDKFGYPNVYNKLTSIIEIAYFIN